MKSLVRVFVAVVIAAVFVSILWQKVVANSFNENNPENAKTVTVCCMIALAMLTGIAVLVLQDRRRKYVRKHETASVVVSSLVGPTGRVTGLLLGGLSRRTAALVTSMSGVLTVVVAISCAGWLTDTGWSPVVCWALAVAVAVLAGALFAALLDPSGKLLFSARKLEFTGGSVVAAVVAGGVAGWGIRTIGTHHGRVEWLTVATAAVAAATATVLLIGQLAATKRARVRTAWRGRVAASLGVPETVLAEDANTRWGVTRNAIWVSAPLPAQVINGLPKLGDAVAQNLPAWEVAVASPEDGIRLVRVNSETTEARAIAAATGGLCTAEQPGESTDFRPNAWDVTLSAAVSTEARAADAVAAIEKVRPGSRVVFVDRANRRMVRADLDAETARVRDRIAASLGCASHQVELKLTHEDQGTVGEVVFAVLPQIEPTRRVARIETALEDLGLLPANEMWSLAEDKASRMLVSTRMERPTLPATVSLESMLPDVVTPELWSTLPLGVGADGQPVCVDLLAGPHALVVGPTGSGKTVGLVALASQALTRGHQLAIIDPTKAGLDFLTLRPFVTVWADTYDTAQEAMTRIYAEGQRRKRALQQLQMVKWSDATDEDRAKHGLSPMTVVIDEVGSLFLPATEPKGLPKDHPMLLEAQALNVAKAVITELSGRVARELRFVGIHLQVAMQRPDAKILSGELRSNLTSAVQLVAPGKPISPEALGMVFTADMVSSAYAQITALDDGKSRGLAVVGAEGGTAQALRVAYAPASEVAALLDARGVPRVETPWDVTPNTELRTAESDATKAPRGRTRATA